MARPIEPIDSLVAEGKGEFTFDEAPGREGDLGDDTFGVAWPLSADELQAVTGN
jgi:hypothetical protein